LLITHWIVLPSSYHTICWPVVGDHHRSPTAGVVGGTDEMVIVGVRWTSVGNAAGGGAKAMSVGIARVANPPPEGWVCTHEPPLEGLRYQTYSRPVVVLNHKSPSAGAVGGVGELVTVGGAGITPP
jgi:hypothetical protein